MQDADGSWPIYAHRNFRVFTRTVVEGSAAPEHGHSMEGLRNVTLFRK
jgi:hypothetical protein